MAPCRRLAAPPLAARGVRCGARSVRASAELALARPRSCCASPLRSVLRQAALVVSLKAIRSPARCCAPRRRRCAPTGHRTRAEEPLCRATRSTPSSVLHGCGRVAAKAHRRTPSIAAERAGARSVAQGRREGWSPERRSGAQEAPSQPRSWREKRRDVRRRRTTTAGAKPPQPPARSRARPRQTNIAGRDLTRRSCAAPSRAATRRESRARRRVGWCTPTASCGDRGR